jgi:hypothetical protein
LSAKLNAMAAMMDAVDKSEPDGLVVDPPLDASTVSLDLNQAFPPAAPPVSTPIPAGDSVA